MNAYTRGPAAFLGLIVLLGVCAPAPLEGQDSATTPIFLALPETFPDVEARVVLIREPGRDIVVLKSDDAEPETLQVALLLLRRMTREHPVSPDRGQLIPITGFVPRSELDPEERSRLEEALSDLGSRPLADVGNLGLGRWMPYRER
jgi:hypothetical protein